MVPDSTNSQPVLDANIQNFRPISEEGVKKPYPYGHKTYTADI